MRSDRDLEKVLDAWLAPGPTEMPDRLFFAVLGRVERTPQRRVARIPRRYPTMFAISGTAAAAALVVIFGLATIRSPQAPVDVMQAPGSTSSPSASSIEPIARVWASAPRSVDGLTLSDSLATWRIDLTETQTLFQVDRESGDTDLHSAVTSTGPGRVSLRSLTDRGGCPKDTVGSYRWSLSADGRRLTVTSAGDECPQRAEFLEGAWTGISCDLEILPCMGVLEPGRHGSAILDLRRDARDRPVARQGALTYEVPAGWASVVEGLSHVRLAPVEVYEAMLRAYDRDLWKDQIAIWAGPLAIRMDAPGCQFREDPSAGADLPALADWLTGHPKLIASAPEPITIDDHDALVIDLDVTEDASAECAGDGDIVPFAPLFANGQSIGADGIRTGSTALDDWILAVGGHDPAHRSDPIRVVLIDVDGNPLVVTIDTREPADQPAFLEQAMPIVESFRFTG